MRPGPERLGPGVRSGDWLKRSCTFDRNPSSEDPRNHAETPRRSTPVKSSHVQNDPLCTWESATRKPTIRKNPGIMRKTRNCSTRALIPAGMLGGAALVLYGLIGMLGVRIWQDNKVNFNNPVNLIAAAVALVAGIGNLTLVVFGIHLEGIAWGSVGIIAGYPLLR